MKGLTGMIIFMLILCLVGCTEKQGRPTIAVIDDSRLNDQLTVKYEKDAAVVDIHGWHGIGNAMISPEQGVWPKRVLVRLHTTGMENFTVDNGRIKLITSIQSSKPYMTICEMVGPGKLMRRSIDPHSPYWIEPKIVGQSISPENKIPLKQGYFEMQLPQTLFEENTPQLKIEWVDFYR